MAEKWYYLDSGFVRQEYESAAWPFLHSGLGWHGPFDTKQQAIDFYNKGKASNPGWKPPKDAPNPTPPGQTLQNDATSAAKNAIPGLGLNDDEIRSWLIRIGEILLGVVLIGVGVAKLTGTTNVISTAVKARI